MCGFVALWNRQGGRVDLDALRRGTAKLSHRGPDDEGYVLINSRTGEFMACGGVGSDPSLSLPPLSAARDHEFDLALAHRRLSIVDLSSAAHQPMQSVEGDAWIVFNGMVYNFAEIRRDLRQRGHEFRSESDTEVVLNAYREWGPKCVDRFNGMWAFAIWDMNSRSLFVSRDRFGIKPIVFHDSARCLAVSSEIKGITPFGSIPKDLDPEAVHHYLSLLAVPAPYTAYKAIRKLRPGHSFIATRSGLRFDAYWHMDGEACREVEDSNALEEVRDLLEDSVKLRLVGDVPAGSMLSGGLDSSLVTAMAARRSLAPLKTFSFGVTEDRELDESPWAKCVSAHVGTDHRVVSASPRDPGEFVDMLRSFDEPFAVSSVIGIYHLAKTASDSVKVLLTGDGGDEVFAGYARHTEIDRLWDNPMGRFHPGRAALSSPRIRWSWMDRARTRRRVANVTRAFGRATDTTRDTAYVLSKLRFNELEKRTIYTGDWQARTRDLDTVRFLHDQLPATTIDRLSRWQIHDIRTSLSYEMLAKVDLATMAWGIEARLPFLDHRLVPVAIGLSRRLKIDGGEGKQILRRIAKPHLPDDVIYRPKQGFGVPLSQWMQRELRPLIDECLDPASLRDVGILEPREVQKIVRLHETRTDRASAHMMFQLVCLQLWLTHCRE